MKAKIRLIDANKLQTTTTYFGISDTPVEVVKKSVIDNAKTVEAVPLSVIEKIKTGIHKEITSGGKWSGGWYEVTQEHAIKTFDAIIYKAVKGVDK